MSTDLNTEPTGSNTDLGTTAPCPLCGRTARLHTPAAAAELLGVKERWVRDKASTREIPCTFAGKHLRFSDDDLAEIVRMGARPAQKPPAPRQRDEGHGDATPSE